MSNISKKQRADLAAQNLPTTPQQWQELRRCLDGQPLCTNRRGRIQEALSKKGLIIITFGEWMCRITPAGRKALETESAK